MSEEKVSRLRYVAAWAFLIVPCVAGLLYGYIIGSTILLVLGAMWGGLILMPIVALDLYDTIYCHYKGHDFQYDPIYKTETCEKCGSEVEVRTGETTYKICQRCGKPEMKQVIER